MAVSRMTAAQDHSVCPFFESTENKHRIYTAGTGNADDLYICRIGKSAASCQVSTCITAPVTAERYDLRSECLSSLLLSTYCIYLRDNLSVGESLQIHRSGRTGNRTCTTALTKCIVHNCHTPRLTYSMVIDLYILIGNRSIWAYIHAQANIRYMQEVICLCCTWICSQLIFCQQSDCFYCCCSSLCNGFRNILSVPGTLRTGRYLRLVILQDEALHGLQ